LSVGQAAHFVYQADGNDEPLLLSDEELASFYQVADAIFFSSRQEGFGIPILEAGLARLPVFCTDLSPFHESAGPHATFFSPDTVPSQVAQTIVKTLHQDRAFQLRRRVLAGFTWQGIVNQKILPLLQTVVE
jgi:glycosyltransferase involved in cell wall biosynthesis